MRTLRSTALLLLCLLATVHGIRLEREVSASLKQQIHEEKKSLSGGTVVGAVVLCKGGHCSSGHARKLITMDVKEMKHEINDERHPDITDLVEMDYHPVKRKSPVHN